MNQNSYYSPTINNRDREQALISWALSKQCGDNRMGPSIKAQSIFAFLGQLGVVGGVCKLDDMIRAA